MTKKVNAISFFIVIIHTGEILHAYVADTPVAGTAVLTRLIMQDDVMQSKTFSVAT
jgi:hypothetical protein